MSEIEDGMGCAGLVPTRSEREQDRRDQALREQLKALTSRAEAAEARVAELEAVYADKITDWEMVLETNYKMSDELARFRLLPCQCPKCGHEHMANVNPHVPKQPLPEPPNAVDFVAEAQVRHTTEDDYQHFLSYSGLTNTAELQLAYYAGAGETMECAPVASQDRGGKS